MSQQQYNRQRFEGKTAIVTGAGSGIGKAAAIKLAQEGANVALFDLINERTSKTEAEINAIREGAARAFDVDTSDAARVEKAVLETAELFGSVDVVFANAGINGVLAPIEEMQLEDWQQTLSVNLNGTFLTVKYAIPHLKKMAEASLSPARLTVTAPFPTSACRLTARPKPGRSHSPKWRRWSWPSSKSASTLFAPVRFRPTSIKARRKRKS